MSPSSIGSFNLTQHKKVNHKYKQSLSLSLFDFNTFVDGYNLRNPYQAKLKRADKGEKTVRIILYERCTYFNFSKQQLNKPFDCSCHPASQCVLIFLWKKKEGNY